MARTRMVTRTVEVYTYEVMCLNTETAEVTIEAYKTGVISGSIIKYLRSIYETEIHKLVSIKHEDVATYLYGMPEDKFIELAEMLPPRSTNAQES